MNLIPLRIVAGDSAKWTDLAESRDGVTISSVDWAMQTLLRGPGEATIDASASGDGWLSILSADISKDLPAGTYSWFRIATKGVERITLGQGSLLMTLNPLDINVGPDQLTTAAKALQDCEAALASFNGNGARVKRYSIGSRQMEFHSLDELMKLRNFWQNRVLNEQAAANLSQGRPNPRILHARFR